MSITQSQEQTLFWGYSNRCKYDITRPNTVSDQEVRALILELLKRQRGSLIVLRKIVIHLQENGIEVNTASTRMLKEMLPTLGLVLVGRSSKALTERYRISNPSTTPAID